MGSFKLLRLKLYREKDFVDKRKAIAMVFSLFRRFPHSAYYSVRLPYTILIKLYEFVMYAK